MRELVRLPFLFLYRILMPAGEFEMLGLERGHFDLTASDSFLFERKKRKEERSCGDRRAREHVATLFRRGYLSS